MKRLFFVFLMPLLLFGKDIFVILPLSLLFLFIYSFTQATTPRYRVDQAFKVNFLVMILALIDFIIIMKGIL